MPTILRQDVNSSYSYNVTYKDAKWINKQGILVIDSNSSFSFDEVTPLIITVKGSFNLTKTTSKNQNVTSPIIQLTFSAFSSKKDVSTDKINELTLGKTYQTYLYGDSNLLMFYKLMMDYTSTYTYALTTTIGSPTIMVKNG